MTQIVTISTNMTSPSHCYSRIMVLLSHFVHPKAHSPPLVPLCAQFSCSYCCSTTCQTRSAHRFVSFCSSISRTCYPSVWQSQPALPGQSNCCCCCLPRRFIPAQLSSPPEVCSPLPSCFASTAADATDVWYCFLIVAF